MTDGPGPEAPKGTVPLVPTSPTGPRLNGGPLAEIERGTTIDPLTSATVEQNFMASARRSAAIIAAKNSGIESPTEEDIQRVSREMDERASKIDIPGSKLGEAKP